MSRRHRETRDAVSRAVVLQVVRGDAIGNCRFWKVFWKCFRSVFRGANARVVAGVWGDAATHRRVYAIAIQGSRGDGAETAREQGELIFISIFPYFRVGDVTDGVLYLHLQERIVRRSVTELIPRLAAFSPARFAESYLSASAATLLATIRSPGERDAGFMAVGDLAAALASDDADKDGADVDQSDGVSNEGTTHRAARLLGSRDGSAGYLSGKFF